ncbi:hypothetical protein D3C75_1085810 [compost metagenome]
MYVVTWIAIIEPRSDHEINAVFPEISRLSNVVDKALRGLITGAVYHKKLQSGGFGDKYGRSRQAGHCIARNISFRTCGWFRTIIGIICLCGCCLVIFDVKGNGNRGIRMPHRQIRSDGWSL